MNPTLKKVLITGTEGVVSAALGAAAAIGLNEVVDASSIPHCVHPHNGGNHTNNASLGFFGSFGNNTNATPVPSPTSNATPTPSSMPTPPPQPLICTEDSRLDVLHVGAIVTGVSTGIIAFEVARIYLNRWIEKTFGKVGYDPLVSDEDESGAGFNPSPSI